MIPMLALILISFLCGIILTLVVQIYIVARYVHRQPALEIPYVAQTAKAILPQDLQNFVLNLVPGKEESCDSLNLFAQFLFKELKDTKPIREWVTKKMNVEFEELLQTTTGRLVDEISVRHFNLGNTFPIVKSAKVASVKLHDDKQSMEELDLKLDIDYSGGFKLAVDVDLIFGKSAFLSVELTKLKGRLRLQLSRLPFTHWSLTFYEEPIMEFEVDSRFEGRPIPQLTSLIINQLRRTIRKKHTLPFYKIRYAPLFRKLHPEPNLPDVKRVNSSVCTGKLQVGQLSCSRLMDYGGDAHFYSTVAIDSAPWVDVSMKKRRVYKTYEVAISRLSNQNLGLLFKEEFNVDKYENVVVVEAVFDNSPAKEGNIRKGDIMSAVNGVKINSEKQAAKLIKQAGEKFSLRMERVSVVKPKRKDPQQVGIGDEVEDDRLKESTLSQDTQSIYTEPYEDYISITEAAVNGVESDKLESSYSGATSMEGSAMQRRRFPFLPKQPIFLRKRMTKSATESKERETKSNPAKTGPSPSPSTLAIAKDDTASESVKVKDSAASASGDSLSSCRNQSDSSLTLKDKESESYAQTDSASQPDSDLTFPLSFSRERANIETELDLRKTSLVTSATEAKWNENFTFEIQDQHKYFNICVWCKTSAKVDKQFRVIKPEMDFVIGHVSIPLMEIADQCLATTQGDRQLTYALSPSMTRAGASRSKTKLSLQRGYDESLTFGDITLTFRHDPGPLTPQERKKIREDIKKEVEVEVERKNLQIESVGTMPTVAHEEIKRSIDGGHRFVETNFHSVTYCNFCGKKIWLKAAFQCLMCTMICHKKCSQRCQASITCPRNGKPPDVPKPVQEEKSESNFHRKKEHVKEAILTRLRKKTGSSPLVTGSEELFKASGEVKMDLESSVQSEVKDDIFIQTKIKKAQRRRMSNSESAEFQAREDCESTDTNSSDSEEELNLIQFLQKHQKTHQRDEQVVSKAKEMGRDLHADLPPIDRRDKLDAMITKFQQEIDLESEFRADLLKEEKEAANPDQKIQIKAKVRHSEEKIQALGYLMLHYCAGLQHCLDQMEEEKQKKKMSNDSTRGGEETQKKEQQGDM